ncbi:tetratricopeptide repeat protein [Kitasatospora sp. NBC_00085]|uniref:hypothetical protein n=1 Tax=unclassified Kitasatospora TaxID=2633591 RepID=UPI00324984DA
MHNSISGGEFQNVFMAHTINVAEPPAPAERVILMDVPVIRHYVNNHELFTRMDTIRAGCRAEDVATRILLWGMPGIGVTAAADRWVREHQTDLPTIQLRAELSPNGQHADATAVLEDWLDQLGVPKQDRPGDQAALARCFQRRTAGLPVLVLIDGARTAAQVRPLLPGSRRSIALITSHDRLGGLRGSHDVEQLRVGPLDDEHSDALLARVADLGDETKAARLPLVRACAGIPLALRILAARLVSLGPAALRELVAQLDSGTSRLEELAVDDISFPRLLDEMYRSLDADSARAYRLLGLHPTLLLDEGGIRALLGAAGPLGPTLDALRIANLLDHREDGRHLLNGVVHEHAGLAARLPAHAQEREAALDRILAYYTDLAEAGEAAQSKRWRHDPADAYRRRARAADGAAVDGRVADGAALGGRAADGTVADGPVVDGVALDGYRTNLVAAVETANRAGRHDHAWRICQGLWTHCLRGGHHTDWIRALRVGVASALETGDLLALARMHYELGFALLDRFDAGEDDPRLAREHLAEALRIARGRTGAEGHRRTASSALEALGLLSLREGDPGTALGLLDEALGALDGVDHRRGLALLGYHRGRVLTALGRHADAEAVLRGAAEEFARLGDGYNVARSLTRLAEDRLAAGLPDAALALLTEALEDIPDRPGTAYQRAEILRQRGDLHRTSGAEAEAVADWTRARAFYAQAGSTKVAEVERLLSPGSSAEADQE